MFNSSRQIAEEDWQEFLTAGFCLRWSEEDWLIGHSEGLPRVSQRKPGPLFTPDFFLEEPNNWREFSQVFRVSHEEMTERFPVSKATLGITWPEPEFQSFKEAFEAIGQQFYKRRFNKAVPVVFAEARQEVGVREREHILCHMVHVPQQFAYGYWSVNSGVMGVTPEILFEKQGKSLQTMALAGTAVVNGPSLLDDPKERKEHQLVVDGLIEKLSDLGPFETTKTVEWELGLLKHLLTLIKVEAAEETTASQLIKRLHPTAALGVSPLSADWKWLKRINASRGRYGAPFGVADYEGVSRFVVAIRNIDWVGSQMRLGSGCGLVAESVLEKEWAELQLKRDSVKRLLGL